MVSAQEKKIVEKDVYTKLLKLILNQKKNNIKPEIKF